MMETWVDIQQAFGRYQVSDQGAVRSVRLENGHKPRVLKSWLSGRANGAKYKFVSLSIEGVVTKVSVHRLVAAAFVPNPEGKAQVNHLSGDSLNNHVENLEWATNAENNLHAYRALGRVAGITGKGHRHPKAKPCTLVRGGEIVKARSASEAARLIGANPSQVVKLLAGITQQAKGWRLQNEI
jgi:hypothetical protein